MRIRLIIIAIYITTTALNTSAQADISLKAGVNISSITSNDVDNANFKSGSGFYGGFAVAVMVSKKFSVQPELFYSTKGYSFSELSSDNKTAFSNFCAPVLLQYKIASGFYAETGPQFSLLLSAKIKSNNIPSGENNIADEFKKFAFSWGIGAGYNAGGGSGLGIRYNFGISSISENNNYDAKFNILRLGLSYRFRRPVVKK